MIELENSEVWSGPPKPAVEFHTGAASSQPTKIGEDDYQLIDHVFYDGKDLFDAGHLALHLREHKTGAYGEDRAARARVDIKYATRLQCERM